MNILIMIKNNQFLMKKYGELIELYYCILSLISPRLNTKVRYQHVFHKKLNLDTPKSFNEKLLYLKLNDYIKNPLVIQCADKYAVREYVSNCGYSHLLNELYGVYENTKDIAWDNLPQQFVLKWNFGAGMNIICSDKSKLNERETIEKLKKWGGWRKAKSWLLASEMQYKYAPKKIVCEKFLQNADGSESIPDYKVYCFNGEPQAIFVMHDRGKVIKTEFFDTQWNPLQNSEKYKEALIHSKKPECLNEMLDASRAFSKPFPFVRCDFFVVDGKLYFGELTFTPAGGLYTSQTKINGKDMSDYLSI